LLNTLTDPASSTTQYKHIAVADAVGTTTGLRIDRFFTPIEHALTPPDLCWDVLPP
jgi:hypothetical protein